MCAGLRVQPLDDHALVVWIESKFVCYIIIAKQDLDSGAKYSGRGEGGGG